MIQRALARLEALRAQLRLPYFLSLLADAQAAAGDPAMAAKVLDGAIEMARDRTDRCWLPELYRQRGLLAPATDRDRLLREALSLANAQGSRSLARRIEVSLDSRP